MSLEDLGNIGEFVAAVAVVVSLIYLAVQIRQNTSQIRQNTEATWVSAVQESTHYGAAVAGHLIQNKHFARIFRIGAEDMSQLTQDERTQFDAFMNMVFAQFHVTFYQHEHSMVSDEILEARTSHMLWFLRQPGVAAWWSRNQGILSQSFRHYVDKARSSGQRATNTTPSIEE
jgi:hypothetical protein